MTNSRVNFCFVFNVQTFALFRNCSIATVTALGKKKRGKELVLVPRAHTSRSRRVHFTKCFRINNLILLLEPVLASTWTVSSLHGKTGVCPLTESVEEHESVFQKAGSCDSDSSRAFNNNLLYYSDFLLLSLNLLKHSQWSAAQSSPTLASNLRS